MRAYHSSNLSNYRKCPWPYFPRFVPAPGYWVTVVPPVQWGSRGCGAGKWDIQFNSSFVRCRTGTEDKESLLMYLNTATHAAIQSSTLNVHCRKGCRVSLPLDFRTLQLREPFWNLEASLDVERSAAYSATHQAQMLRVYCQAPCERNHGTPQTLSAFFGSSRRGCL